MFLPFFTRPDPDADLVSASRSGDARAFDALVYRYQGSLTQFVRARLNSAIDADDVAQEIFVAAWRELPRFRGQSRFKTWLFGIGLNYCAEAARRHMRLRRALGDLDDGPEPLASLSGAPWNAEGKEWSAALAEREEVHQCLGALPEAERQVLDLYYYADLNLREISELLNVNLSTLKYRFYQAHRRLRTSLAASEATPAPSETGRVKP